MGVRLRGKKWHYKFMLGGVYYTGVLEGVSDEEEAKKEEEKVRARVILGIYEKRSPGSGTFSDFVDAVFLPYSKENKATYKHDDFRCREFKKYFAGKSFAEITPMVVVGYVNSRLRSKTVRKEAPEGGKAVNKRRSPTTVRKEIVLLSSIFNMAINEEWAVKNPCKNLPKQVLDKIPARNKRERFLTEEEEQRLFDVGLTGPREYLRPLVRLALNTGVRRGGLLGLRREHVNLGSAPKWITVEIRGMSQRFEIKPNHVLIVKNKRSRPYAVPLNAVAREAIEGLMANEAAKDYLFVNEATGAPLKDVKKGFRKACDLAGLDDFTFHDLRHTFSTRLKEAGFDSSTRRDLMGHTSTAMTDDYTHTPTASRQRAVDSLAPDGGGTTIGTNDPEQVRLRVVNG